MNNTVDTVTGKPRILKPRPNCIPDALKAERRWVCWKLDYRKGERKPWTKVPINSATDKPASSTDPKTWGTFEAAMRRYEAGGVSGIGFMLGDGWVGIDVDHCVDDCGQLNPTAIEIRDQILTYGELSVSGTGVIYLVRGNCRGAAGVKGGLRCTTTAVTSR